MRKLIKDNGDRDRDVIGIEDLGLHDDDHGIGLSPFNGSGKGGKNGEEQEEVAAPTSSVEERWV
jgi:hypothetical protein